MPIGKSARNSMMRVESGSTSLTKIKANTVGSLNNEMTLDEVNAFLQ